MWPPISNNLGLKLKFWITLSYYKKIGLNDVHVGCDDGKAKDIHNFITFEQIMIKYYIKLIK
jgi:hypothetical protein